jgi:hypothetical protein
MLLGCEIKKDLPLLMTKINPVENTNSAYWLFGRIKGLAKKKWSMD